MDGRGPGLRRKRLPQPPKRRRPLWDLRRAKRRVEISVRRSGNIHRDGIKVHRRSALPSQEVGTLHRIPITSPVQTLIDLATELPTKYVLRAINEADKLEVILADDLRSELDAYAGVPGAKRLVTLLDKDTFVLTQEELERLFLPLVREWDSPSL